MTVTDRDVSRSTPVPHHRWAWIASLALVSHLAQAEVLFTDNFDDQPDFTSTMHGDGQTIERVRGHIFPDGWDRLYQGTKWSPETGHPDKHASLEILAANADKAKGGTGKSAVFWRESHSRGWKNWASDAQFIKVLDGDHPELYIEFDIRFSDNWYQRQNIPSPFASKIFRVGHWNRKDAIYNGNKNAVNPRFIWQYKADNYGLRNVFAFLQGPPGNSANLSQGGSYNYRSHLLGHGPGGSDPALKSLTSGQLLTELTGNVTHEDVFGPAEQWTKVAFYVKMNSAPGAADGVFRQWIRGHQVTNMENLVWIDHSHKGKMLGWNYFAIGGNDYFQAYPNEDRFEDWYAIDNVVVATRPLEHEALPEPPLNVRIVGQ